MSNENFDLEELLASEANTSKDSSKDKSKNKKGKKSKASNKVKPKKSDADIGEFPTKRILLGSVLPAAITLFGGLFIGATIFSSGGEELPTVESIQSTVPITETIDTIKDSQIKALQEQIGALKDSDALDYTKFRENKDFLAEVQRISDMNNSAAKAINPFFDKLLTLDRYASEQELDNMRKDLMPHVDETTGGTMLYDLLTATSPAKEVESNIIKSGSAYTSQVSTKYRGLTSYLTFIPFVDENDKSHNAIYLVTIDPNNVIKSVEYEGLLKSTFDANKIYDDISNATKEVKESKQQEEADPLDFSQKSKEDETKPDNAEPAPDENKDENK